MSTCGVYVPLGVGGQFSMMFLPFLIRVRITINRGSDMYFVSLGYCALLVCRVPSAVWSLLQQPPPAKFTHGQ